MMIVMKEGATDGQIQSVVDRVTAAGAQAHVSRGEFVTVIGAIGDDREMIAQLDLAGQDGVERVVPILKPYKLVSREFRHGDMPVVVDGVKVGGGSFGLIAGPCTVETREQTLDTARVVKAAGAAMLRGGAYKPRTSPYSFRGLGREGLQLLKEASQATGLPTVSEVTDPRQVEEAVGLVDMLQVGTRNMSNFDLLVEVGRSGHPVLLKRGQAATIGDWLLAAEYVLAQGNPNVVLCERGVRGFDPSTRNLLDLSAVPVLRSRTHLPVLVDPSHATGHAALVPAMARAACAAGADGVMIEVHSHPAAALCDAEQAMLPDDFRDLVEDLRVLSQALLGARTAR